MVRMAAARKRVANERGVPATVLDCLPPPPWQSPIDRHHNRGIGGTWKGALHDRQGTPGPGGGGNPRRPPSPGRDRLWASVWDGVGGRLVDDAAFGRLRHRRARARTLRRCCCWDTMGVAQRTRGSTPTWHAKWGWGRHDDGHSFDIRGPSQGGRRDKSSVRAFAKEVCQLTSDMVDLVFFRGWVPSDGVAGARDAMAFYYSDASRLSIQPPGGGKMNQASPMRIQEQARIAPQIFQIPPRRAQPSLGTTRACL